MPLIDKWKVQCDNNIVITSKSKKVDLEGREIVKWPRTRRKFCRRRRHNYHNKNNNTDDNPPTVTDEGGQRTGTTSFVTGTGSSRRRGRFFTKFNRRRGRDGFGGCRIKSRSVPDTTATTSDGSSETKNCDDNDNKSGKNDDDDDKPLLLDTNSTNKNVAFSQSKLYRRNVEYRYFRNNFIVAKAGNEIYSIPPSFVSVRVMDDNVTNKKNLDMMEDPDEVNAAVNTIISPDDTNDTISDDNITDTTNTIQERKRSNQFLYHYKYEVDEYQVPHKIRVEMIDLTNDVAVQTISEEIEETLIPTTGQKVVPKKVSSHHPKNHANHTETRKQMNKTKFLRIAAKVKARREQTEKSLNNNNNDNHDCSGNYGSRSILQNVQEVKEPFCDFTLSITGTAESIVDKIEQQLQQENNPSSIKIIQEHSVSDPVTTDRVRVDKSQHHRDVHIIQPQPPPTSTMIPFNTSQTLPNGLQWKIADNYLYQHSLQMPPSKTQQQPHHPYQVVDSSRSQYLENPAFHHPDIHEPNKLLLKRSNVQRPQPPQTQLPLLRPPSKIYNHPNVPRLRFIGGGDGSRINSGVNKGATLRQRLNFKDNEIFIPRSNQTHVPINTPSNTTTCGTATTTIHDNNNNPDWRFSSYVTLAQPRGQQGNNKNESETTESSPQHNKFGGSEDNNDQQVSRRPDARGGTHRDNAGKALLTPELVRTLRQPLMHSKPFDSEIGLPVVPPPVPTSSSSSSIPQNMNNSYLEHASRGSTQITFNTTNPSIMHSNDNINHHHMRMSNSGANNNTGYWLPPMSYYHQRPPTSFSDEHFYNTNKQQLQQLTRHHPSISMAPLCPYSTTTTNNTVAINRSVDKDEFSHLAKRRADEPPYHHEKQPPNMMMREASSMTKLERAIRNLSDGYDPFSSNNNDYHRRPGTIGHPNIPTSYHQYPQSFMHPLNQREQPSHLNYGHRFMDTQSPHSNLEKLLQWPSPSPHHSHPHQVSLELSRIPKLPPPHHPPPRVESVQHNFNIRPAPQQYHYPLSSGHDNPEIATNLAGQRNEPATTPPKQQQHPQDRQLQKLSHSNPPPQQQPSYLINSILQHQNQSPNASASGPYQCNHDQLLSNSTYKGPSSSIRPSIYPPAPASHQNSRLEALLLAKSSPAVNHQYDLPAHRRNEIPILRHHPEDHHPPDFHTQAPATMLESSDGRQLTKLNLITMEPSLAHSAVPMATTMNTTSQVKNPPHPPVYPETTESRLLKEAEAYKPALITTKGLGNHPSRPTGTSPSKSLHPTKLPDCPDLWGPSGSLVGLPLPPPQTSQSDSFNFESPSLRSYLTRTRRRQSISPKSIANFHESSSIRPELSNFPPPSTSHKSTMQHFPSRRVSKITSSLRLRDEGNDNDDEDERSNDDHERTGNGHKFSSKHYFSRLSDDDDDDHEILDETTKEKIRSGCSTSTRGNNKVNTEGSTKSTKTRAKQKHYIKSIFSDISSSDEEEDDGGEGSKIKRAEERPMTTKTATTTKRTENSQNRPQNNNNSDNSDLEFFCTDEDSSFIASRVPD